jgi:hypothetical protein
MNRELTVDEIRRSDEADARGEDFANLTPAMAFGVKAPFATAARLKAVNPRKYEMLRNEFLIESGLEPTPQDRFHSPKV